MANSLHWKGCCEVGNGLNHRILPLIVLQKPPHRAVFFVCGEVLGGGFRWFAGFLAGRHQAQFDQGILFLLVVECPCSNIFR